MTRRAEDFLPDAPHDHGQWVEVFFRTRLGLATAWVTWHEGIRAWVDSGGAVIAIRPHSVASWRVTRRLSNEDLRRLTS